MEEVEELDPEVQHIFHEEQLKQKSFVHIAGAEKTLREVGVIMRKNFEKVMNRGEALNEAEQQSLLLEEQSREMYEYSRRKCCPWWWC